MRLPLFLLALFGIPPKPPPKPFTYHDLTVTEQLLFATFVVEGEMVQRMPLHVIITLALQLGLGDMMSADRVISVVRRLNATYRNAGHDGDLIDLVDGDAGGLDLVLSPAAMKLGRRLKEWHSRMIF